MSLLIEHPEAFQTETLNPDETLCREFFDDIWVRGNTDRIEDYLDDHFHWNAQPGYTPDRAGYVRQVNDMHRAFPDLYGDLVDVVANPNVMAAHWMFEGHHEHDWAGVPATGNKVRMEGIAMSGIQRGMITNEFSCANDMQVLAQLGVTDLTTFNAPAKGRSAHVEPSRWERLRHPFS